MTTHTINDDVLHGASAETYFTRADRRVMIGLRATLEMLGLPTPEYAQRKTHGPRPARAVLAAFHADNPEPRAVTLSTRKPNASPKAVATARARSPFA